MKKLSFVILSILIITAAFYGCGSENISDNAGINFHETPQTYILSGEDAFMLMPTVTLYENGNARLSQPMISSLGMFGLGHFEIKEEELIVSHGGAIVTFTVSDDRNALTIKASDLQCTKVGLVYKYQSNADYLSKYKKNNGEQLTVESLRQMSQNAQNIVFSDFDKYAYVERDPDYRIFNVEGRYTLTVVLGSDGQLSCTLSQNSSGKSFPLNQNGSTGLVLDEFLGLITVPKFTPSKWLDYYGDEQMPWGESKELTLSEFSGVTFKWTPEKVTANGKDLFFGMPVWNVFLADLTNDGKPELCATVSFGSGIVDTHVIVYDYINGKTYALQDRMMYDYFLSVDDGTKLIGKGKLIISRVGYADPSDYSQHAATELQLVNGEIRKP